jgi:hypothetical protein
MILCFSVSSIAQVKYVEKGTPAPYTGYLFTPEKEKETRFKLIDLDYYKKLSEINTARLDNAHKQNELLSKQVDLWQNHSKELSKELATNESRSFWKNILYFGLGAIITVGLTYSVNQASKR